MRPLVVVAVHLSEVVVLEAGIKLLQEGVDRDNGLIGQFREVEELWFAHGCTISSNWTHPVSRDRTHLISRDWTQGDFLGLDPPAAALFPDSKIESGALPSTVRLQITNGRGARCRGGR